MKNLNHTILGGGLSSLINDQIVKNAVILCDFKKRIEKSNKFYEQSGLGGNTLIWGGYVNFNRFKKLKNNKKFNSFFRNTKLFKINRLSEIESNTFYLSEKNLKIFRVQKNKFNNPIIEDKIIKIEIDKKFIKLIGNKVYKTKKLSLCIGNYGLLKLLYESNIIKENDIISFQDGECSYSFRFFLNQKENYYIPMKILDIIRKFIFKKIDSYKIISGKTLIYQKFSKKKIKYKFKAFEILKNKSSGIRFFLSNHIADLRINNIRINNFLKKKSNSIKVYNSGMLKNYIAGPISQDLIYEILNN